VNKKIKLSGVDLRFDGKRFQRLRVPRTTSSTALAKAIGTIRSLYRSRFGFMNLFFAFVYLGCAFFVVACADHDDATADHRHHGQHSRGDSSGGQFGNADSSRSATPIPGL
jgi:hypothetical protein